ncbi:multidrug efflux SMR transporter [Brevibacillus sp. HB1.2]|uniref:DMT family transporter n=1 Tax=Brevibacillus TaxID=55080 RepID=UPI000370AF82|nr:MULTISPECIES: multidrug efflux SMR transporter [unclassified Brevibacillus]ATF10840.1 QacE family quaternary ammonium compound efflux SMR transporter [Brevibacillus brevis X23]NRS20442.1 multidrug efflux SMR transporter [Brevibacillus sp. HB1.4B]NTU24013.1 multidrug efflux SMR transporter [Brevibacillus sp. HB1.2]NTU34038.1 multidrug efflux SMR transporter [Brevibacillus sp. HB1.1]
MAWAMLIIAGFAEIGGVISLKLTEGFTKWKPTVACLIFASISFYLLSSAVQTLPVGTAYAVWTGIGSAGSVLVGMLFFKESRDRKRILFMTGIVISIVGLKFIA